MTPERLARLKAVLNRRQPDLAVITDFVNKGRNLSAILRNCDAAGIGHIHAVLTEEMFRAFRGTAAGSHKWVETHAHDNVGAAITAARRRGMKVYAANLSPRAVDYRTLDYCQPFALLLGAERDGVSGEALSRVDGEVYIPMFGMVESFNVAVASAIILMEARRQREEAGLYDSCRLDDEEYNRLMVEWGQTAIARFCRAKGLAYPRLDDNGDIPAAERERLKDY